MNRSYLGHTDMHPPIYRGKPFAGSLGYWLALKSFSARSLWEWRCELPQDSQGPLFQCSSFLIVKFITERSRFLLLAMSHLNFSCSQCRLTVNPAPLSTLHCRLIKVGPPQGYSLHSACQVIPLLAFVAS